MKRPRWACFEPALIVLFWLLMLAPAVAAPGAIVRFDSAEFLLSESAEPPPDSAAWQPLALPDLGRRTRPGVLDTGWYRLQWRIDALPSKTQALYLPKFGQYDYAFVNGTPIDHRGFQGPGPQLFAFAPPLLRVGGNIVHLRVRASPWLMPIATHLGDETALRGAYETRKWLETTGADQLSGVAAALGLFMLLLWSRRRTEGAYAYFGLASVSYALWLPSLVDTLPFAPFTWPAFFRMTAQLIIVSTFVFALRYGGWRKPRLETALWLSVPLGMVVGRVGTFDAYYLLIAAPLFFAYVLVFGWVAWRRRTPETIALLLASPGCAISFALYDGGLALSPVDLTFALQIYSFVPLFVVMGWLLARRFVRSLDESEQLNAELEQRVEQKHAELQRNYARMQQVERQAAVTEERARIMSDMHDGIGGQLISTLSLVENGQATSLEVSAALRECIDDLRLSIDSLQPADAELLPVLGNLRYRLEPRLAAQGISLDWQVADVPKLDCLTPQNILHIPHPAGGFHQRAEARACQPCGGQDRHRASRRARLHPGQRQRVRPRGPAVRGPRPGQHAATGQGHWRRSSGRPVAARHDIGVVAGSRLATRRERRAILSSG
jgi:signal transduction histidine kinase